MKAQPTQQSKETMNDSFFFRKSIISNAAGEPEAHHRVQNMNEVNNYSSNFFIPGAEAGMNSSSIDRQKKNSIMETFVRKTGMVAIVFLIASLFFASNAFGQFPVVAGTATSSAGDNLTSHTVSLPSGVETGDLLIVIMGFRDRSFQTNTVNFPTGWTELVTRTQTTGQGVVFYKVATATEAGAASITVSTGTVDARRASIVYRIQKNTYVGTPQASFSNATSMVSATNPNPPSLTPSWGLAKNLWIVGAAGTRAGTTPNTATFIPANFSNGIYAFDNSNTTNSSASASSATREFEGTSLDPASFALTSTIHRPFTIAIQGAIPASITTTTISGSPFCVTALSGTAVSVPFTSSGTYTAGNIYTAQLSDASGGFGSPTNIGTLSSTANSGTISANIPLNTSSGTGYRIRAVSSNPVVTGSDNGTNLTINLATASVSPSATQDIGVGINGDPLTVTESSTASSRQWFVSTTNGGPYIIPTGVTSPGYTPMFGVQGTYYVVCISTFPCGNVTSNQVVINVAPTITTGLINGSPFCVTTLNGSSSFSVPFTSNGTFQIDNVYTAQLSDASGSFASPVNIGTLTSDANSGSINATIPANTPSGSNYRVRVISSNPQSLVTDNQADLVVDLSSNSISPSAPQMIGINANGSTLNVTESPGEISREWLYSTTSASGPFDQNTNETSTSYIPNFSTQGSYYIVCVTTFPCGLSRSNVVQVDVVPTVATGTITGSPFCVTTTSNATVEVPFTSVGNFSGNTYTAQLSNALGSFAVPVNIGTLLSDANSGSISATIPAGTVSFGGYRIRVISNGPAGIYTDNGDNLTINLSSNSIAPVTSQNISVGQDGALLTVTETPAADSRVWLYSASPGGPYTSTGIVTETFTPNFPSQGIYYVVCVSTFTGCGTATSNEVQINVTATVTTGTISGSPFCAGASFELPFTSAGTFSGNTYTAQLSNATGSFASPVTIGTLTSDANSGQITVTIPAGTAAGTGYLVRVIASNPTTTGSSSGPIVINRAPVASFNPTLTGGTTGTLITFEDQSSNSPTSWSWSLPGTAQLTSTDQDPTVMYISAGTHSATLTATNDCGSDDASTNIVITALTMPATFTASGSFTVPPGVTCIQVQAWGAGGGGGNNGGSSSGGGGGGAYASRYLSVAAGQNYSFVVGAGGAAGVAGGQTYFNTSNLGSTTSVVAAGGGSVSGSANGGAGGSIANSNGTTVFAGGNGGNGSGTNDGGGGGGGSALTDANGGNGASTNTETGGAGGNGTGAGGRGCDNDGNPAAQPGFGPGGGGGGRSDDNCTSQAGAPGEIIIAWIDLSNFNMSPPACTDGVTQITVNSTSLGNGNYIVTYNTTNPTTTGNTATMTFTGGSGSFPTIALAGPVSTVEITGITLSGWTCTSPVTTNNTAEIRLKPTATISYSPNAFCVTDATIKTVTQTGQGGGTYSATPAGLSINASTGEVNPLASTPGTYTVRYDFEFADAPTCPSFTTTTVIIGTLPVATFNYPSTSYCQYLPSSPVTPLNPLPVFTGGGIAGTFSAPAGLNFVSTSTGQIDLAASTPGVYTVTNTVTVDGCTNTATFDVTIYALPAATIAYSAASFCKYSGLQSVQLNTGGFVSGSYSVSPAGLTINGNNNLGDPDAGQIDPSTSVPGIYTVTFTFTDGTCSNTTTTTVEISAPADVAVTAELPAVCIGTGTNINIAPSSVTTSYQLFNSGDNSPVGAAQPGNGGALSLPTGPLASVTSYYVVATVISTGCSATLTATATVAVNLQPLASAGGNVTICSDGTATVIGASSSNGTILWTHDGAGSLTDATSLSPTYHAVAADGGNTVTLMMTVSNDPCTPATAIYSITVNPVPAVTLSTSSICIGSVTTILSPATGGTWVSNNPSVATVANDGTVTAIAGGTTTFTFTNSTTNCSSTTGTLTVDPACQVITLSQPAQLTATISGDNTICPGTTTTISVNVSGGTAPYKVTYDGTDYTGSGPIITFSAAPTSGIVFNSTNVTVTDANNCTSVTGGSATIDIIPESSIVLQTGPSSQEVCSGIAMIDITYALGGTSTGASVSAGSLPQGVTGGMNGNNFIITGTPTESGTFNFTITTTGPCPSSVSGSIIVNPVPVVSFSGLLNTYCVDGSPVTITGNNPGGTFTGTGITDNLDGTATFSPNIAGAGTYLISYTFTNTFGCTNTYTQSVTVNPLPVLLCPPNMTVCLVAGSFALTGATPVDGAYSGTGVSNGIFDPAVAGIGDHVILYTYTDLNGCTNTCQFTIKVVQLAVSFDASAESVCSGTQPGLLSINVSGGLPIDPENFPYFYQWQQFSDEFQVYLDIPGEMGASYQPTLTDPGTYIFRVRVIDQCGEIFSEAKTIVVNPLPVINGATKTSHNGSDLTCATSTDGEITVDASGAAPLMYSNDNGVTFQASNVFSNLGQGTYTILVKDINGCVSLPTIVTIIAPEVLTVGQSIVVDVTCFEGNNGSINLGSVSGGTPPYHYVWTKTGDPGFFVDGTTPFLTGLTAGTYNYNITDINVCANVLGSVTIMQPEISMTKTNVACNGNSTGTATVTVTGTAGPFDFTWRNAIGDVIESITGNTTGIHTVTGLSAGTYNVTVVYGTCTNVIPVTITEPPVLTAQINSHLDINCVSATSGAATVTPGGGTAPYTYLWNDGQTTATATGLAAGNYSVTVTDINGCTAIALVTILQDPVPVITNCPITNFARNTNTGTCQYTISGTEFDIAANDVCPLTYTYTLTGATIANNITGTLNGTILQKGTTHITCVVSDGLQSSTCSFDVIVADNEAPVISCPANVTINCQDSNDPDVNTQVGKATATDNCSLAQNIVISILSEVSTQDPNTATTGHYNYTITRTWKATDEAGIFSTCEQIINVHDVTPPINVGIPADITVSCASMVPAADDGAVFAFDNCSSMSVTHEDVISNNNCVNRFIISRTYTVTDISGNATSKTQTITVFDDIAPVISSCPPASVFCFDISNSYSIPALLATDNCGSVTISYHITGATERDGTGNDASGLFNIGVSTIEWTVVDACNNTSTCSTTVTVYPIPPTPVVEVSNNCGSSTLSTTAAGSLLWTPGNLTGSSITVTTAGTYFVTSTINGCTSPAGSGTAAPITIPPTPVVTVVNNCDGTSVLSTTATGNLLWSNFSTGPSITVFTGGTYSVTQSNSCYTSAPGFGVAAPTFGVNTPTLSVMQPTCTVPTGTITVTSPTTEGLTYSKDNGLTYQASPVFTLLDPGTYSIRVRTPAGCASPVAFATIIAQPNTPAAPVVTVVDHCNGTSTLSTTATGNLLWSNMSTGSSITVSIGGTYSVTQTVNGCTSLPGSGTAAPATTPNAPVLSVSQPNCTTATGTVTITIPTGTGLEYSMNGGVFQESPVFANLTPNTYSFRVRNLAGCMSTLTTTTINAAPLIPSTPVVTVQNNCNGTSTLSTTATGILAWSTGASGQSITVANAGDYWVTQTVNGCTSLQGFGTAAPQSTPTTPVAIITQPNCSTATATITVMVPTGSGLAYSLNGIDYQASPVFNVPANNSYNLTVKNAACTSAVTIIVVDPQPEIPATPLVTVENHCNGTSTLSTTATGSLMWSTGGTGQSITVSIGGSYSVVQRINGGCWSLPGFGTAAPNTPPAAPTVVVTQPNCATATGIITVTAPTGAGWTYSIDGTTYQAETIFNVAAGVNYNVTAKNSAGCVSGITSAIVNAQPVTPSAPSVGTIVPPSCTVATGSVTLNDLPAGNWIIYPGGIAGNTASVTISLLNPGTYNFNVTNAAGCVSPLSDNVVISQPPSLPSAPAIGTITHPTLSVATGSVILNGLPAGTWTINPVGVTGSTSSTTIENLIPGTHNFTVTNAAGCTSLLSANVVINPQPTIPLTPIVGTITQPDCNVSTGSVQLSGLPEQGIWTLMRNPGGVITFGTGTSTTVTGIPPGTYNYTVTSATGYTSLATIDVVINPQPVTPAAPQPGLIIQPTCLVPSGSVTLNGLPSTGTWTLTRSPGGATTSGTGTSTTIAGLAQGTYTFTVSNGSCTSPASTNVVINEPPVTAPTVAPITGGTAVCVGSTLQLENATAAGVWSVTNGTGTATISGAGLLTAVTAGNVTVVYTVTTPCGTATATSIITISALPTATISYIPPAIPNRIVALPFNEGAGPTAADVSGNNHNGTLTNAPTWITGRFGQGINLNGTTNYVNIADHNNFTLTPTQNYTWSGWVKNTNFNEWSTIWSQTVDASNFFYFYAHSSTDGEAGPVTNGVSVYWYNGANKLVIHSNNNVLSAGVWSHITVTYNGAVAQANKFTIYVNGVDVTNRTDVVSTGTIAALNPGNIRIGSNQPYGEFLNGAVDEFRYYTRLLTGAEIASDMLAAITAGGGNGQYCQTGTAPVTLNGPAGGTYSATPAGLSINSSTGLIDLGASAGGVYTVSYTFSNATCTNTATTNVTVFALQPTSISYDGGTYCQSGAATVTLSGQSGGTYSGSAGLSINSSTGAINLAASALGTHTVTYSYGFGSCSGTATTSITIVAALPTTISYAATSFCQTGTATVSLTGQAGGTYSSAPGLSIDNLTGAIDLSSSLTGSYTVTYSFTNGSCTGSATANVSIVAVPTASIAYLSGPYCQLGTAAVTHSGQTGGVYTSTPGLSINSSTGLINLAASGPGTYTVTYTFSNGACGGVATTSITIAAVLPTSISYSGSPYCQTGIATVSLTGQGGGTFSSTSGLSINSSTGEINLAGSALGTYTVTYNFSNGNCSGSTSATVSITAIPTANITYAGSPFCPIGTATVSRTGQAGGTYSSTTGLVINSTTGAINLAASLAGTYTVTYSFGIGGCSGIAITTVTILPLPATSISYPGGPFCQAGSVAVVHSGQAGGTYSAAAGLSINSSTGAINLAASTPGTYTVNYNYSNGSCTGSAATTVTINTIPVASISYPVPDVLNQVVAMPMNEGAGTTASDIAGVPQNGTLTGGPAWITGRHGQGVNLNGTTHYINVPDHADFTLSPTQNYTWSAWVRNTNFNEWSTIWSQTINTGSFFYFYAHTSTDPEAGPVTNGVSVYWYNGANKLVIHSNNNVLSAGVWSHITVTYNGAVAQVNRFTIYVNGVDVTNRTDVVSTGTIATINPTNIRIGSNQPFGEFLNGAVDEVRFYNRLLTGAETAADANTAIAPVVNGSFCTTGGTATVTQTGQAGGTYSSTPGLSIDGTTGTITLGTSLPGTYTVTYSFTNGGCAGTATTSVSIVDCGLLTRVQPVHNNPKQQDAYLDKQEISLDKMEITVYPNPAITFFNLKIKTRRTETVDIRVYDMQGKMVQQQRGAPQQIYRLGDNLASGMYVVEVRQAGQTVTTKMIKQSDQEANNYF